MAEYVLVNDIHLADRPPSSCTDTYLDDLFDLLTQSIDVVHRRGAAALILAGDVFHSKTPSRTSHRTTIRLIEALRGCRSPVFVVPGNHDLQHDRLTSLAETQPLGVVIASGAAHLLAGWSALSEGRIDDPVYGVPWQMCWQDDVVADVLADWRSRLTGQPPGLVVTHAPLYPPGHELPYENFPAADWARHMNHHGTVHYGHVHEPHGIYTVDGVTFSNSGALSRGSLHEHNLTRDVAVAVWNSTDATITHCPLQAKAAADVFRLAEVHEERQTQARLDEFLTSIGQTTIEITSIEAVMAHVRSLQLGTDLETIIDDLLSNGAAA